MRRGHVLPLLVVTLMLAGIGSQVGRVLPAHAQRYVPTADPKRPRLKYPDSLMSANDRCMVSHAKLNSKVRPVYVNGVPMGFC